MTKKAKKHEELLQCFNVRDVFSLLYIEFDCVCHRFARRNFRFQFIRMQILSMVGCEKNAIVAEKKDIEEENKVQKMWTKKMWKREKAKSGGEKNEGHMQRGNILP